MPRFFEKEKIQRRSDKGSSGFVPGSSASDHHVYKRHESGGTVRPGPVKADTLSGPMMSGYDESLKPVRHNIYESSAYGKSSSSSRRSDLLPVVGHFTVVKADSLSPRPQKIDRPQTYATDVYSNQARTFSPPEKIGRLDPIYATADYPNPTPAYNSRLHAKNSGSYSRRLSRY